MWSFIFIHFPVDTVDVIDEESEEAVDNVAVLTSNVLFFIVMFIFAIYETCVFWPKLWS